MADIYIYKILQTELIFSATYIYVSYIYFLPYIYTHIYIWQKNLIQFGGLTLEVLIGDTYKETKAGSQNKTSNHYIGRLVNLNMNTCNIPTMNWELSLTITGEEKGSEVWLSMHCWS